MNPQPPVLETGALPVELLPYGKGYCVLETGVFYHTFAAVTRSGKSASDAKGCQSPEAVVKYREVTTIWHLAGLPMMTLNRSRQEMISLTAPTNEPHAGPSVPVGISNRHVHLSREDLDFLFGAGFELTKYRDLSQHGQYAANEMVTLVGPKGVFQGVRILGPVRRKTQVEISRTDAFQLGVKPPVRDSGEHDTTPGLVIVGPKGALTLKSGVLLAKRHIHMTPSEASRFGLQDRDIVQVRLRGPRALIFDEVLIRVDPTFALEMHVDTDEANAAMLNNGDTVEVLLDAGRGHASIAN